MQFIEKFFQLKENNTTIKTEVIAGLTTFLTMVYIIFVNPDILSHAGMDKNAVFVTTCIISGIATLSLGVFANLPIGIAPGLGINAFFTYFVVNKLGYSWQVAMGAVFLGCVLLFLVSAFHVRYWLLSNIPASLRYGIGAGIGLFITLIGLHNMGIVVANPHTMVTLGNLHDFRVMLGILGFMIMAILMARGIHSGVFISIVIIAILGLIFDPNIKFSGFVAMPPSVDTVIGHVDIIGAFDIGLTGIIFAFALLTLFDSSGTLLSMSQKANLVDKNGELKNLKKAILVDSSTNVLGAWMGTSALSAYIESGSGISVGGRTGLTAVVVGVLFLVALFFSPIVQIVPSYATAGALVYVGVLMSSELKHIPWDDLTEAIPAFITTIMMPFTYSITEGIGLGFIAYVIMKAFSSKRANAATIVIAALFLIKFVFID